METTNTARNAGRQTKVMLFCPVRLEAKQIPDMLRAHAELSGVDKFVYVDECEPDASRLLRASAPADAVFIAMEGMDKPTYANHNWTQAAVSRVASLRNLGILNFNMGNLSGEYTHLFIVDADLILHPETVLSLLEADKDIVSEVFWSQWPNMPQWLPNCWDYNEYAFDGAQSVIRLRTPGVYKVGGLGACTLIRSKVVESGFVNYFPIYNRRQFGEDRDFCLRAVVAGYELYVDTKLPAFHVYRPHMLEEGRMWRDKYQCNPYYFAERWLTPEWESTVLQTELKPEPRKACVAVMLPGESFSSGWVANWTNLFGSLANIGHVMPFFGYSSDVYVTRACMWDALKEHHTTVQRADYVLWIDDDNLVTPQQLEMLMQDLDANPDASMVAGWCWIQPNEQHMDEAIMSCGRLDDRLCIEPFKLADLDDADSNMVPIGYTGFPVVLMRGSMLENLSKWPFRPLQSDVFTWGKSGEDVAFCVDARNHGHKIFVDRRVKVPHLKRQPAEPLPGKRPAPVQSPNPVSSETPALVAG